MSDDRPHEWLSRCVRCERHISDDEHRTLRAEMVTVDLIHEERQIIGPICDGCLDVDGGQDDKQQTVQPSKA